MMKKLIYLAVLTALAVALPSCGPLMPDNTDQYPNALEAGLPTAMNP